MAGATPPSLPSPTVAVPMPRSPLHADAPTASAPSASAQTVPKTSPTYFMSSPRSLHQGAAHSRAHQRRHDEAARNGRRRRPRRREPQNGATHERGCADPEGHAGDVAVRHGVVSLIHAGLTAYVGTRRTVL